ncbi:facilitated trehalose transporter Tret1-like isoform X2 [Rhodnius prolixus]
MKVYNPELVPHEEAVSWISAVPPLGALFGSLMCGPLMQNFGPRKTLLLGAPLFTAAWIYISCSPSWLHLVAARACTGFSVGIVLPSAQLYVNDCSMPKVRGMVGSLPALFMAAGILVAYVLGTFLKWETLAVSCAAFPALLFCLLFMLPESPVWLQGKGRFKEAEASLKWLHRKPDKEQTEMAAIADSGQTPAKSVEASKEDSLGEHNNNRPLWSKDILVPFGLTVAILIFQQISGIDSIVFYTVSIFQASGSPLGDYEATMLVGLVQLLATIVSLFLIDYYGRKPLLISSGLMMGISMTGLGTYFYLYSRDRGDDLGLLPLICQFVFTAGYSIGYCNVPFILMGELLHGTHRSLLSSIAGACNLGSMFIVIKTFPNITDAMGSEGAFWMYAGFCLFSCVFVYFLLPETKGKTLEEIQRHFQTTLANKS